MNLLAALCLFVACVGASRPAEHTEQDLRAVAKTVMDKMAKESVEKKCSYTKPGNTLKTVFTENGVSQEVMIQSPCLAPSSLGNWLSEYFESIVCANHTGFHFATIFFLRPEERAFTTNPFFEHLPKTIPNTRGLAPTTQRGQYKQQNHGNCPCNSMCHEYMRGLMHQNGNMAYIGGLFRTAMDAWVMEALRAQNVSVVAPSITGSQLRDRILNKDFKLLLDDGVQYESRVAPLFHSPDGKNIESMPFIPDVAIHYRCGDNLVTHYSFASFEGYRRAIPEGTKSIYVMAESPSRKAKANSVNRCNAIFDALFSYLKKHFPTANVVIMRGQPIFSDLARLTYASTVFCSVSTFCLWPAVATGGPNGTSTVGTKAYYPQTRLLAKGPTHTGTDHLPTLDYGNTGFTWINVRSILGREAVHLPIPTLVKRLEGG